MRRGGRGTGALYRPLTAMLAASLTLGLASCGSGGAHTLHATDVAPKAGLAMSSRTWGALVFDYDNDGWVDILLGRHDNQAYLFHNEHGHFVRSSFQFPRTDRHQCAAGDVNGDHLLDFYCAVGGDSGNGPKPTPNELWIQQPDHTFVNEGGRPDLADPWGRGRQAAIFDTNGDGRPDIFVANVYPRNDGKPTHNRLFLNEGSAGWRDAPEMGLDLNLSVGGAGTPGSKYGGGDWPLGCVQVADVDGDGRPDLLLCGKGEHDSTQRLHLFHNDGDKFTDVSTDAGLTNEAQDAVFADMNGDGRPDVVTVNRFALTILTQNAAHKFTVASRQPITAGWRVAVGDATGDGKPDIYVLRTRNAPGPDVGDRIFVSQGDRFDQLSLPPVPGKAVRDDEVYAVDALHEKGKVQFLVLHGHTPKPVPVAVQLISVS